MAAHRSSTRSRVDVPGLKPEAGLAEWTSKIKASQRQDADEEAEQIRLEEEIAASRLARIRRSQGLGYGSRGSLDVSKFKDGHGGSPRGEPDAISMDSPKTLVERQSHHADSLQRLTGASSSASTSASIDPPFNKSSANTHTSYETKPQTISLAAFMGGRATGPRLNKHTPQQDAHDPTQFQQRAFDHAPHPTFGSGGVAMPGIAVQRDGPVKPSAVAALSKAKPSGRVSELPPTIKTYSETYERQSPLTRGQDIRERTLSTPSYSSSSSWAATRQNKSTSPFIATPRFPLTSSTSGAGHDRDTRTRSISPTPPVSKPIDRPITPRQPADITMTSPSKSPISVPSLAGPIRPQPRPSTGGPQIPSSVIPSKAFMRPPSQKEPTPSLSRLQGRGFVQSMVQVSSKLESPTSIPESPEKRSARKSSVLDRWHPNVSPVTTSPPPSPTPRTVRRSITVDPTMMEKPKALSTELVRKPLKSAISNPSLRQQNIPPRSNPTGVEKNPSVGLGSATTLVVYETKPIEDPVVDEFGLQPTGSSRGAGLDLPPRPSPSSKPNRMEKNPVVGLGSATTVVIYKPKPIEVPVVDEFGSEPSGVSQRAGLDLPAPSKPLSHPTKERARKPRKRKTLTDDSRSTRAVPDPHRFPGLSLPLDVSSKVSVTNEKATPREALTTLIKTPSPASSADDSKASGKATDQLRRSLSGLVTSRQADAATSASKSIFPTAEARQSSNPLVRQALPGLAVFQANGKPSLSKPASLQTRSAEQTNHGVTQRALPGMVAYKPTTDKASESTSVVQSLQRPSLLDKKEEPTSVTPLSKLSRIPSTGNRATVMDVAQALSESGGSKGAEEQASSDSPQPSAANRPRSLAPSLAHAEKRKSSYEKYSSIILPPLKEEATPTSTPAGTLSRREGDFQQQMLESRNERETEKPFGITNTSREANLRLSLPADSKPSHETMAFPPSFNIDSLLKYNMRHVQLEPGTTTISVEVMAITGTTASILTKDLTIFYDTEILAIIHRSKSLMSGLVSTAVWGWEGKRATLGEREQRKLQELAKRYGTSANIVHQHSEPPQLVHILGGVLATRQGTRTHWTSENTAMHVVRSLSGVILVDEKDLNIANLCSAYSYCVSILDSVYVWYGRGSTPLERKAALEYGRSLKTSMPPIELIEDASDDDEMFWMILGDEDYASADYWKWRRNSPIVDPRIWRVNADLGKDCVASINFISKETCVHESVYIIDCIWEFYIVVGSDARAHRQDIELALRVVSDLSTRVSSARPFTPNIHALIFPSQLPKDLRLVFRDLDEFSLNKGEIPDHMNILSAAEAYNHLKTTTWDNSALQDQTMLPLGVDTSQPH